MDKTLKRLPGEGKVCYNVVKQCRRECDICGEDAHYKHTWLLKGTRSNPASKAYNRDDCSWCEDNRTFACRKCTDKVRPPDGYVTCSVFPASTRFAHMFLDKKQLKIGATMADAFEKLLSGL